MNAYTVIKKENGQYAVSNGYEILWDNFTNLEIAIQVAFGDPYER